MSEIRPPSTNHLFTDKFTTIGTIDVLINLANVNLKATDKLYVV